MTASRHLARRFSSGWAGMQLALLVAAIALLTSQSAWAQADAQQKAAAEALFDEGKQLLSQGQVENACRRFEQSQEIDPAVGILLYLGDCYERLGKPASAWAIFREATSKASAAGQTDRAHLAEDRARKLAPTLSRLVLLVPQEDRISGFELILNGRVISSALFGVAFPIDPGSHEVIARAPGRRSWTGVVDVRPNAEQRTLQLPALDPDTTPAAAPPPAVVVQPGAPAAAVGVETHPPPRAPSHTGAYVLGGAGIVAVGVGAVFGLRAAGKDSDSKADCPSGCKTLRGADLNESARSSALIANITYGLGAVALLTSAYFLFLADPAPESVASAGHGLGLGASLGAGQGQVLVSGSF